MKFNPSEAWRDATAMIAGNREVLLIVAGLFFFLPSLVLNFLLGDLQNVAMADPEQSEAIVVAAYAQWWWLVLVIGVISMVGSLALLALLRDHGRPTVGEAIKTGLAGLLPALAAYLLITIAAFVILLLAFAILVPLLGVDPVSPDPNQVALIAVIAFALLVYPAVRLSLLAPVVAIEKVHNPFRILARSWQLTKGNVAQLLLFYFLLLVVYLVVVLLVGMVVAILILVAGNDAGVILNALISGALSAAMSVIIVAVIGAAHRQLAGLSTEAINQLFE